MSQNIVFPVESGFPIPSHGEKNKYDFSNIGVGDSVFFPAPCGKSKERMALMRHAFRHDWKPVTRSNPKGTRVWRTAKGS